MRKWDKSTAMHIQAQTASNPYECVANFSPSHAAFILPQSYRRTHSKFPSRRCQNTTRKINHRRLYLCTYANQTNSLKIESDVSIPNVWCSHSMHVSIALQTTMFTEALKHEKLQTNVWWWIWPNSDMGTECVFVYLTKWHKNVCSLIGPFAKLIR